MKTLETEFTFRGETFRQLRRKGDVALYQRGGAGYEVIRIKVLPAVTWPSGRVTEERESYPGDNEFGLRGWYFMRDDLDRAEKRYRAETRRKT